MTICEIFTGGSADELTEKAQSSQEERSSRRCSAVCVFKGSDQMIWCSAESFLIGSRNHHSICHFAESSLLTSMA
jgi:hypothetical protein